MTDEPGEGLDNITVYCLTGRTWLEPIVLDPGQIFVFENGKTIQNVGPDRLILTGGPDFDNLRFTTSVPED